MTDFTHLHVHTEYSLLDGACRIAELVDCAKNLGQSSLAITDHGVMYGAVEFYKKAKNAGIKPIIGCEVYVAPRSRFDKNHTLDSKRYHLILLCKNEIGYRNLIKLVSLSWVDGFYTKPRVDREILERYSEGLIALSGCLFGEVAQNIALHDYEEAKNTAVWYNNTFGQGNYYLEIQNHGMREELEVIDGVAKLSEELNIPLVATNDVHYCTQNDADIQRVLIAIQTNKVVGEDNDLAFEGNNFYLRSGDEMAVAFSAYPDAISNTVKIADQCNFDFEFGVTKLPLFDCAEKDHAEYLKKHCLDSLNSFFNGTVPEQYKERLNYELSIIHQMGFDDYFLIVSDFISFAKKNGIPVGPGRGSAAGSLAAFSLGITGIDPIKNNLLFERFLNPERVSMPDIDIDFCYERRGEVIDYVTEKYGKNRVAQIVTFGTLQAKAAVRDVARALGLPYSVGDTIAKQITRDYPDIMAARDKNAEFKNLYQTDENIKKVIDTAIRIEGMPRHASTHAAGVVITRDDVSSYVPLAKNGDQPVIQYTMTEIEELGLLKMDFLGLRTLTVIHDAEEQVKLSDPSFSISAIPMDSEKVFSELCKGNTVGIFQCESAGMTNLIVNMQPQRFEDIAAALALYRPGPMYFINDYIRNRQDKSSIQYRTPLLKEILDETYGCMVYQEQVMQVFRTLAGYSYGRADLVRRAMSKKKHDVMENERQYFIHGLVDDNGNTVIEGCVNRGIDENTANNVFDDMISFASYGFNKSHTVAYGMVAYQTAYLKAFYPCEFLAALLTSVLGDVSKTSFYVAECRRLGIKILPPHVNFGCEKFVCDRNTIVFSLLCIKNVGRGLIRKIVDERTRKGEFSSFWDFCKRVYCTELNRRALDSLIKSGALDHLGLNRREMIINTDSALDAAARENDLYAGGQLDFFSVFEEAKVEEPAFSKATELPKGEMLAFEKECTGLYFTGHPLEEYKEVFDYLNPPTVSFMTQAIENEESNSLDGQSIRMLAIVNQVKKKVTKKDEIMAFCEIEDLTGSTEMIVFPKLLAQNTAILSVGSVLLIEGRISVKDDELKVIPDKLSFAPHSADELPQKEAGPSQKEAKPASSTKNKRRGIFIRELAVDELKEEKAKNLISIFSGDLPVYFYRSDEKKYCYLGDSFLTVSNIPMINELKHIFGDENVIVQE